MSVAEFHTGCDVARSFRVRVALSVTSDELRDRLSRALASVSEREIDVVFSVENLGCTQMPLLANYVLDVASNHDAVMFISDKIAFSNSCVGKRRNDLAATIRRRCLAQKAIIYILALTDQPCAHILLVDNIIAKNASENDFVNAFSRALSSIRYKSPPARKVFDVDRNIYVKRVNNIEEFRACLALRHNVYSLLGYIHEYVRHVPSILEIDCYDPASLHFAAIAATASGPIVVGTARLIVPDPGDRPIGDSLNRKETWESSRQLCEEISREQAVLAERAVRPPNAAPLPLLAAFDQGDLAPEREIPIERLGELSRVVVTEGFRGHGVSNLLIRACIAAAKELGLQYILLECIPQHVDLYQKFGFEMIPSVGPRIAWRIDQVAVVMHLGLPSVAEREATRNARGGCFAISESPRVVVTERRPRSCSKEQRRQPGRNRFPDTKLAPQPTDLTYDEEKLR